MKKCENSFLGQNYLQNIWKFDIYLISTSNTSNKNRYKQDLSLAILGVLTIHIKVYHNVKMEWFFKLIEVRNLHLLD